VVAALQAMPFKSGSFDNLCCFNVLEHVYEAKTSVQEMFRVLHPRGSLFIFVPFLVNVHPDPYDYHRYTGAALEKLLIEAGFRQVEVTTFFGLCSSLLNLGLPLIPFRIARAVIGLCTMALDTFLYGLKPAIVQNYVIAYAASAKKIE
jgi:SAM-dependent methyltransferase